MNVVTVIFNGLGLVLVNWLLALGLGLLVVFLMNYAGKTWLFPFVATCMMGAIVSINTPPRVPEQYLAILVMMLAVFILFSWAGSRAWFKRE